MNYLISFCLILINDLKLGVSNFAGLVANAMFFVIFIMILNLTIPHQEDLKTQMVQTLTVINICFITMINGFNYQFIKEDFEDGSIDQIFLSCESLEIAIGAKVFANWIKSSWLTLIILPIYINFVFDFSQIAINKYQFIFKIMLVFSIISFILNSIASLSGSISIAGSSFPLSAIIALPLMIPTILIGQIALIQTLDNNIIFDIEILLGMAILSFIGSVFAISKIIENSR